jgi:hypothetical protein
MGLAEVERSYGELLAAFGDLVVARSQGEAASPPGASMAAVVRRYRSRRRAFGMAFAGSADPVPGAGEDARAWTTMRATLAWLDELEPTPGATALDRAGLVDDDPAVTRARGARYRRYGSAAGAIRFDGETLDRPTVLGRLATEPDAAERRRLFLALEPLWQTVDGDGDSSSPYRRLLASSAAHWAEHGSPVHANVAALRMPVAGFERALHQILAAWRSVVGPGRIEPWDYRYAIGGAARRLDQRIPEDRLLGLHHRYLASLGADPETLGIRYDVLPRESRPAIPVAFSIGMGGWAAQQPDSGPWTPRPPWVFATYAAGGLGSLAELLHESGHALHSAAVRTRPAFLEWPEAETAFLEGTADVLGWDADEPAWQAHWLGDAAEPREALLSRYGAVMLDICWALFEIELHRHPERRPNTVWTEITTDGLGIVPHPEWSWWAIRGQLIDLPGYMANYALSAIVAAAVRERTRTVRGAWLEGDPGWYGFMSERLFAPGASRRPADLLADFLGAPLTVGPLLADLQRTV